MKQSLLSIYVTKRTVDDTVQGWTEKKREKGTENISSLQKTKSVINSLSTTDNLSLTHWPLLSESSALDLYKPQGHTKGLSKADGGWNKLKAGDLHVYSCGFASQLERMRELTAPHTRLY